MNIYAQRLLNVARALREGHDPSMFTMGVVIHDCGTPACAWGHYASRSDLQDQFTVHGVVDLGFSTYLKTPDGSYGDHVSFAGPKVREHFNISSSEQDELFAGGRGCGGARTNIEAAEYIERFVARKYSTMKPFTPPDWNAMAAQRTVLPDQVSEELRHA